MTWQWIIVMVTLILSVPSTVGVIAAVPSFGQVGELRKVRKALRKTRSVRVASPKQLKTAAPTLELAQPTSHHKVVSLTNTVEQASFTKDSQGKAFQVVTGLQKVKTFALNAEDEQGVEVIESQLRTLVQVFDAIAVNRRDREVMSHVNEQLTVMNEVLTGLTAKYSDDAVAQLKVNTDFLRTKFKVSSSSLTLNKK